MFSVFDSKLLYAKCYDIVCVLEIVSCILISNTFFLYIMPIFSLLIFCYLYYKIIRFIQILENVNYCTKMLTVNFCIKFLLLCVILSLYIFNRGVLT